MNKDDISKEERERQEELIRKAFREDPALSSMVEKFKKQMKESKRKKNIEEERERYA